MPDADESCLLIATGVQNTKMRLAFWQRHPSPHQAPFIREVAARLGPDGVTCVFERPLAADVRRLGWQANDLDYGQARITYFGTDARSIADELSTERALSICFRALRLSGSSGERTSLWPLASVPSGSSRRRETGAGYESPASGRQSSS